MNTTIRVISDWYKPIGNNAYCRLEQKDDELRVLTGIETDGKMQVTGILRIKRDRRCRDRFHLHCTIRHTGGEDNLERHLTSGELRVMFDVNRDFDEGNEPEHAARFSATHGTAGLFIRANDVVAFPNPGNALPRESIFCFRLKPEFSGAVDRLIRTGKLR